MGSIISSTSVPTPNICTDLSSSTADPQSQGITNTNSSDEQLDMVISDEDNTGDEMFFSNHKDYEIWYETLSKYELFPSITKSGRMKNPRVDSTIFPWLRIYYKCSSCTTTSCGFKLTYDYSCKKEKIIVRFNSGKFIIINVWILFQYVSLSNSLSSISSGIHQYNHQQEVGSSTVIARQNQLTQNELDMIRFLGLTHTSRGSIQNAMKLYSNGKRIYDIDLIQRIASSYRKERLGDDEGSLQKLKDFGDNIVAKGGNFSLEHDDVSMKLTGVFIQHPIEILLCQEYASRLVYLDGTHNTCRYESH